MSTQPRWDVVRSAPSTNTGLLAAADAEPEAWPHLSVLLAREQTAGLGRAGRVWESAQLQALTFSVLLRPTLAQEQWGWLPLLAGASVARALQDAGAPPDRFGVKWPNDVVDTAGGTADVPGWGSRRKVGGILSQVLPDRTGVVVGIGLNVRGEALPVDWAGTLDAGVSVPDEVQPWVDDLATRIVATLGAALDAVGQGADPESFVLSHCVTIGDEVEVSIEGSEPVTGRALGLGTDGALLVEDADRVHQIHAGDVHLRHRA